MMTSPGVGSEPRELGDSGEQLGAVDQLVHEDPVPDAQGIHHGLRRYLVGLQEELIDHQHDQDRRKDGLHPVQQGVLLFLPFFFPGFAGFAPAQETLGLPLHRQAPLVPAHVGSSRLRVA